MSGRVEVITGPMYSGKTEELLRRLHRLEIAKVPFIVLKSHYDVRFDEQRAVSRNGKSMPAKQIAHSSEFWDLIEEYQVVALDEAQFLDWDIVPVVRQFANQPVGGRVIITGLDLTYRMEPFGPMSGLLALADEVTKLTAVCHSCGGDARFTQRLIDGKPAPFSGETILVGSEDFYEARCRNCFEAA